MLLQFYDASVINVYLLCETMGTGNKAHLDITDQGENHSLPSITGCSRDSDQQLEVTKTTSAASQKPEKSERQQSSSSNEMPHSDRRDSTHDKQGYHSNHTKELAAERDANSIMKPPDERQATSREVLTPTSPTSKEKVSDGAQDLKACASSWNEIVPSRSAVASANSSRKVVRVDHKHANIEYLSSPQHSRAELLSTATENAVHIQQQKEPQLQATIVVNDGDDSEDELISPEARALITDEILKECQRSSSSFASSSVSQDQEIETMQDSDIIEKDLPLSQPEKQPDSTNTPMNNHRDGQLFVTDKTSEAKSEATCFGEDLQESDHDLRAVSSERELSSKSSCIFVDMSSLNLDQVQEEEAID